MIEQKGTDGDRKSERVSENHRKRDKIEKERSDAEKKDSKRKKKR